MLAIGEFRMIDEKDPNDEAPETAEPTDAAPRTDSTESDTQTDDKVSDKDLDDASGGVYVRQ
jgi:hypothetical protein